MNIAKSLIYLGIAITLVGGLIFLVMKLGVPIGKLPGDITINGKNMNMYFPITTSILLSVILTFLAGLVLYIFRR